jgi:PiT family inorganic phosphate transporter
MLGVALANSFLARGVAPDVNWSQVSAAAVALIFSPLLAFAAGASIYAAIRWLVRIPSLYAAPAGDRPAPIYVRVLFWIASGGISFAHGWNDGQKGIGLTMLVLIGTLPGAFALDMTAPQGELDGLAHDTQISNAILRRHFRAGDQPLAADRAARLLTVYLDDRSGARVPNLDLAIAAKSTELEDVLAHAGSLAGLRREQRIESRKNIQLIGKAIDKALASNQIADPAERAVLRAYRRRIRGLITYFPTWVRIVAALVLGCGTMVAWRRVAATIGTKVGNRPLNPAEGVVAELVGAGAVAGAAGLGWNVSSTHIFTSGLGGTMAFDGGIRTGTARTLGLYWALTLPVTILASGILCCLVMAIMRMLGAL